MPKSDYTKVKAKYEAIMTKEIFSQVKGLSMEELTENVIYNKYELHDARILIGVLTDLLLKHKVITKAELMDDIAKAYKDELKQHNAIKSAKTK